MTDAVRKRAPGAGVKAKDGIAEGARHNVMIDAANLEILKNIGLGSFSLGVREAARRLEEIGDVGEFSIERHAARPPKAANSIVKAAAKPTAKPTAKPAAKAAPKRRKA